MPEIAVCELLDYKFSFRKSKVSRTKYSYYILKIIFFIDLFCCILRQVFNSGFDRDLDLDDLWMRSEYKNKEFTKSELYISWPGRPWTCWGAASWIGALSGLTEQVWSTDRTLYLSDVESLLPPFKVLSLGIWFVTAPYVYNLISKARWTFRSFRGARHAALSSFYRLSRGF